MLPLNLVYHDGDRIFLPGYIIEKEDKRKSFQFFINQEADSYGLNEWELFSLWTVFSLQVEQDALACRDNVFSEAWQL